ncbi:fumarylacetoacetate hydrolase [Leuconostoc litchii]|uniref:FAA hydrolase family protein n=1 Tax=Leuconostoc litchii TaxID=1981069 RepID=A0A6P2CM18_9LACO|nr:fumarylacetoacetate hydrolase family protein [Leuconostoc litchii]TYC47045.1 FAA hydrolase family protein [Leuconostoc litchii]GMA68973.1 fumarylacetoacetate hydrolase [Leuconostoc litchii]
MQFGMYQNKPILIKDIDHKTFQFIKNFTSVQDIIVHDGLLHKSNLSLGNVEHFSQLSELEAPITAPRQIFAVGFNYRDHSNELKTKLPREPNIFTKFPSSIANPTTLILLPETSQTDWETELVVVIGEGGRNISKESAQSHIVGYIIGQDLSDRRLQFANDNPQFSLAKSYANFSPIGPLLTTKDQLGNLADLTLTTEVNGVTKQKSTLQHLIFNDLDLVSYLSKKVALYPGDLIFTGTPGGVGMGQNPQEFLQSGDHLISRIDKLGSLNLSFS